jgi:tetratricopeptide (TPR) repeat protein
MNIANPQERTNFIGRIQEQRQFRMVLPSLLDHHRRWRALTSQFDSTLDPDQVPLDESYARIFLLYGIGGIGKSWLTRRCLELADSEDYDPRLVTLYDDVSLGAPVLDEADLMSRLYAQLATAGYETQLDRFRRVQADLPRIADQVARYRAENRARWEDFLQTAAALVAEREPAIPHRQENAAVLTRANELLLERIQGDGYLTSAEVDLFRNPSVAQAAALVAAFKQIVPERPLVIALDNLEIIVPLELFIRDHLVLPTVHLPLLWILSGRHNLADERVVEIDGQERVHKGYRDLLGDNPPLVWDMSTFGDADLHEFLEEETRRRHIPLNIDDNLIAAVKATSSGVPLVVEMVADALFTLERDEFLQNFVLDDKTLLPANRLEQITARFLRYCLTREDDMERVQALALLRRGAGEESIHAVWALPAEQQVSDVLNGLRMRYAFVQADGLHDAVYEFVRRQLHTIDVGSGVRELLSRRAVAHYQNQWAQSQDSATDPALLIAAAERQETARDLVNVLLWADPDEAMRFFLPRFVEAFGFRRSLAEELLIQVEDFLTEENNASLHRAHAKLLPSLHAGLSDPGWFFNEPGDGLGQMVKALLARPGWESLHFSLLHLWQGNWLAGQQRFEDALTAYRTAESYLPPPAAVLRTQLGQAFYQLSSRLLWPEHPADAVPSEPGLQAAQRAVALIPEDGPAWYNLGVALEYLGREEEAILAYQQAIAIEPRAAYYNNLGDVYSIQGDFELARATYQQAIELDRTYALPFHGLAVIHSEQGEYESALTLYKQAIERHTRDSDRAASWDGLGDVFAALGRYEQAVEAFQQAIKLTPHEALPWYSLGNVYSALERYDEAIEPYRRAIELDPAYAWSYHNLGLVYERRGDYAPAMILFQQAIERHQDVSARALSWNSLGDVYSALDRNQEAIQAYHQAVDLDYEFVFPWNSLGREYSLLGCYEEAVDAYQQVIKHSPDEALPWYSLGNAYSALTQYEEAIRAYQRAIELGPAEAWPYNNLGFVYQKLGEPRQAIELYQQALERHEDSYSKAVTWDNLGNAYRALRNYDEALSAYRWARTLAPEYAWPYHNLGDTHSARGEFDTAIPFYQQAIERHERDLDRAAAWNNLGDAYQALDRLEEAINAYQRVIDLNPKHALPWYSLGNIYRELDQRETDRAEAKDRSIQVIEAYRRAIELDPAYAWPYHNLGLIYEQRGATDEALRLFQQALERHTSDLDRAVSWTKVGDVFQTQGRTSQAVKAYQQAIELDPGYAWPYHNLGLIYEQRQEFEETIHLFQQAVALHREDHARARAWNHLGDTYRALRRFREAIGAYRQAIELDSQYALPWNSVGDVCRLLDRPDEAVDAYRHAVELDPALAGPYRSLALIYSQRGETDRTAYEAAITLHRQAIERYEGNRDRARAWNDLGSTYRALHRLEDAIKAYQQAIELDSAYTLPWVNLGDVYRALSYPEDAIDAYQKAIELEPGDARSWDSLGDVYRGLERPDEAIGAYRQAIELNPDYAWPYASLGLIYEQQEQYEAALLVYQQSAQRHERPEDQAVSWKHVGDIYRHLKRFEDAIEAYGRAVEFDPAYAWPYHNLGLIYEQQQEYEAAIPFYRQAIDRHKNDRDRVLSWHKLGDVCYTLNRYSEAITAYQRVIELDPQDAVSWNSLGTAQTALEHYEAAIKTLEQALEVDPDYAWPYHHLGVVYEKREAYDMSVSYYQQALERHGDDRDAAVSWANLGRVYQVLDRHNEAIEAYQQAINLNPRNALAWDSLGDVYRILERHPEAIEAYQRAIELEPTYAWPYHNLALVYADQDRYQEALPLCQHALEYHANAQDQAISWNNLGKVYHALGRRAEAIDAYERAIKLDPGHAWPYNNLGVVYAAQGDYEPAATFYRQAIEQHDSDKDRSVSWDNLGNVLTALGQYEEAIEAYQQAVTLNPNYVLPWNSLGNVYLGLERYSKALEAYQQAIQLDPDYALPWNGLGDVYHQLERHAVGSDLRADQTTRAIESYRRAIELNPDYAWPYHSLGTIYEQQREYESALSYYQQALERHENEGPKAILWNNMGNIQWTLDQFQEANNAFRQAIALDSKFALPWFGLGNLFSELTRYQEAIDAYRRAIELDSTDAWFYHNLALVYEKMDQYQLAVSSYKQALERHSENADQAITWHNLGLIYHQWGRYQEAVAAFRQAIRLDPMSALPWNSLGGVYRELNQQEQTVKAYRRAIELDPTYAQPYNNLGFYYEQLGEYEQAMTLYKQVIDHHQDDKDRAVSWNNIGNVYRVLQREDEAIEAYRQAIELDPGFGWPYQGVGSIYEEKGKTEEALAYYQRATVRHKQETGVEG